MDHHTLLNYSEFRQLLPEHMQTQPALQWPSAKIQPESLEIFSLARLLDRFPVQRALEPFQKGVRQSGGHQAAQKSHWGVGGRFHITLICNHSFLSEAFCRGQNC